MYNLTNMNAMGNTQEIPFADKQPAFKKMFSIAEVARMSHDELRKYHISQKSYWDACSVLEGARMEGLAEGRAEGRAEGKAEGRTEGRISGIAESIIKLLEDQGKISEELQTRIMAEKDLQVLSKWLKLAARVDSIDVFRERM